MVCGPYLVMMVIREAITATDKAKLMPRMSKDDFMANLGIPDEVPFVR